MSERALARKVVKILKPLDAFRVENPCLPGTPDVNYVGGWIELKQQDKWPKRASTPVRLDHELMPQQIIWLQRREEKGGAAYVLLQVDREYLLLSGTVAGRVLGTTNREELCDAAIFVTDSKQLPELLLTTLS